MEPWEDTQNWDDMNNFNSTQTFEMPEIEDQNGNLEAADP